MPNSSLIPRKTFFENMEAFGAQLSPDGRWISWVAPYADVMNVWIAPSDRFHDRAPLTRVSGRPIWRHQWSSTSDAVFFVRDDDGDEKVNVFAVDVPSGAVRNLTSLPGVSAFIAFPTRTTRSRDEIAVGLNDRDERWHDIHAVNWRTGARRMIWRNDQRFPNIGLDENLTPRWARGASEEGGATFWKFEGDNVSRWFDVGFQDFWTTHPYFVDAGGDRVFCRSCVGRDKSVFVWKNFSDGGEEVLVADSRFDVARSLHDPRTNELLAASVQGAREEWAYVGTQVEKDFARLTDAFPGLLFTVTSQTDDGRRWIVWAYGSESPLVEYLYERDTGALTELMRARPRLAGRRLAPMRPVTIQSRDGLDLHSYLTLPLDFEAEKASPPPMVLCVHGGPWSRDVYGYNRTHQWLANRGYAVLSVNYRGSTGFGKAFVAAGEKQHAAKMHDDLVDAVHWAIAQGFADAKRVAIYGASYGGYAAMVGATFTPELFACAIPVVGISNLETLLASIPPYWAGFAEFMYRHYGDPRTPEGRKLLAERSPIHRVDQAARPMLILHGQNDVRCKVAESETFAAAMQEKGLPVTFVVFPDEGHGFLKPENEIAHIAMVEAFLARHLGGVLEPMGSDLDGSSLEIRCGGEEFSRG
jgi:acylaminoacyl-peptidase